MTRTLIIALVAVLAVCATAARAPQSIARVNIPLDGTVVSLPKMGDTGVYEVRISGTFACEIDGRTCDARYREDEHKQFKHPHDLIVIAPGGDMLLNEDAARHVYTFGPLKGEQFGGESATVRINIERLVDEFIRTPSEVRDSLSGALTAELLYTAPSLAPGILIPAILGPLVLLGIVVGLMIQASRKAAQRPYEDVHAMRRRIQRKAKLALEEMGPGERLFDHLRQGVTELSEAADQLAEHVITYRSVKLEYSPRAIEEEIARLQRRLERVSSQEVAAEYSEEIANKRRTLEYLRANEDREASYLARLSQTETTLDNLRLKVPDLRTDLADTATDQPSAIEVDRELTLLREAVAEIKDRVLTPA